MGVRRLREDVSIDQCALWGRLCASRPSAPGAFMTWRGELDDDGLNFSIRHTRWSGAVRAREITSIAWLIHPDPTRRERTLVVMILRSAASVAARPVMRSG